MNRRVALVTGAGTGIGRATALALLDAGYAVACGYNSSRAEAEAVARGRDAAAVKIDISSRASIRRALAAAKMHFRRDISVLVNNAALVQEKTVRNHHRRRLGPHAGGQSARRLHRSPGKPAGHGGREVGPHRQHHLHRRAVGRHAPGALCGSQGRTDQPDPFAGAALFAARRHRQCRVARSGGDRYDRRGVEVQAGKQKAAQIPIGRITRPDEIAAGVVYLASDAAASVTGQTLNINGGIADVMKTLLILGAGKEQVAAFEAARARGIRTIALDMNSQAPARTLADAFYPVSTRDRDAILKFAREYPSKIDGVMTIASDIPHMVSAAAEVLGARHIPVAAAELCVHKLRMKEKLLEKGVNVPAFARIENTEDLRAFAAEVGYPIVVKPVDSSGARGVQRLSAGMNLDAAFAYAGQYSFGGGVIAEKFVSGLQISTEGLMHDGVFHCTGFADRNYARLGDARSFMVEDGGDIPTVLDDAGKALVEAEFEKATRALGIDWGPSKGDMIMGEDGKPYVIEIAARLSGGNFCYDKVPWSTGVDIVDILVDMAVGNPVAPSRFAPTRSLATSQRYFFPAPGVIRDIRGLDAVAGGAIRKVDVWARPGDAVAAAENHPSRVGYVISCAATRAEAVAAAESAVARVQFVTEP